MISFKEYLLEHNSIQIRPAISTDENHIMDIEKNSFENPWRSFSSFIKPDHQFNIATKGGKAVGYSLHRKDGENSHIVKMAVHSDHRGTGISDALMEKIKNDSTGDIHLNVRSTNKNAIDSYVRNGFKTDKVQPSYYSNGDDAVSMIHTRKI